MKAAAFKDHFSGHAGDYAARRPTYPPALAERLADLAPSRRVALDCACGNGQLALLLADRFERVVASDASAEQIRNARPHPGIDYRVAPAERSGLADASVDLVTVAQAAHWLDLDAFYAEVRRIARPGAIIALITYAPPAIEGPAGARLRRFYDETLEPFGPLERRLVADRYRTLPFPFDAIDLPDFEIEAEWGLADLIGYVETWSVARLIERAGRRDLLDSVFRDLEAGWGDPTAKRRAVWPLTVRAGRVSG
jgi:SAM-dependent methyltransferase